MSTDLTAAMSDDEMPAHYSAALDEIFRLRTALAYEAGALTAHLGYATFPKSRREIAAEQVQRMLQAVQGDSVKAYAGIESWALEAARREAGCGLLTRGTWEAQR